MGGFEKPKIEKKNRTDYRTKTKKKETKAKSFGLVSISIIWKPNLYIYMYLFIYLFMLSIYLSNPISKSKCFESQTSNPIFKTQTFIANIECGVWCGCKRHLSQTDQIDEARVEAAETKGEEGELSQTDAACINVESINQNP